MPQKRTIELLGDWEYLKSFIDDESFEGWTGIEMMRDVTQVADDMQRQLYVLRRVSPNEAAVMLSALDEIDGTYINRIQDYIEGNLPTGPSRDRISAEGERLRQRSLQRKNSR